MRISHAGIGILIGIGAVIAFPGSAFVYFAWELAFRASNYEPATFVVERVEYRSRRRSGQPQPTAYGTIHNAPESIPLSRYGPTPDPKSDSDLKRLYPRGTHIAVLHDGSASETLTVNGYKLRSLPVSYNLHRRIPAAILTTLVAYGPLLAGIAFQLHLIRKEKRLDQMFLDQAAAKAERKRAWREANGPRRSPFLKRKKRR